MNTPPDTPNDRLADASWRRRNSAWLWAVGLGFGLFSFIGFIVVARRVQNRTFTRAAIGATAASGLVWAAALLMPEDADGTTAGGSLIMLIWAAMIGFGFWLNRDYLTWRASHEIDANAWYREEISTDDPARLGPSGLMVNINTATITDLIIDSGLSEDAATRLLNTRDSRGGLHSLEEITTYAGLLPHELDLVRRSVTFG